MAESSFDPQAFLTKLGHDCGWPSENAMGIDLEEKLGALTTDELERLVLFLTRWQAAQYGRHAAN